MDSLFTNVRLVIAVFIMPDCGGCEAYVHKLGAAVKKYGRPFFFHDGRRPAPAGSIPICLFDVSEDNADVQAFATRYQIEATPTTILIPRSGPAFRAEGNLGANQIDHVLAHALKMNGNG